MEKTLTVETGLETSSAALFVQTASKFKSSVQVKIDNKTINAKSIMGLISLGILDGQVVTIVAEGVDEEQALDELGEFLTKKV